MLIGTFLTIIGFIFLLDKLGILSHGAWELFWPVLIICMGLSIIYNKAMSAACDGCCIHGSTKKRARAHRTKP